VRFDCSSIISINLANVGALLQSSRSKHQAALKHFKMQYMGQFVNEAVQRALVIWMEIAKNLSHTPKMDCPSLTIEELVDRIHGLFPEENFLHLTVIRIKNSFSLSFPNYSRKIR
jgi:hypothetical protein